MADVTLASASRVRADLLRNAGLSIEVLPARVDELALKIGLEAECARPRDIADALAEAKARKVASKGIMGLVLGCDQVLDLDGKAMSKANSLEEMRDQLSNLGLPTQI